MHYRYDPEADAIYIRLSDKEYAYGEDLDRERRIDYAADGTAIGIELLCVSAGVSLDDLPAQEMVEQVLKQCGIKILVL